MHDEMNADFTDATNTDNAAITAFDQPEAAKTKDYRIDIGN